MSGNKRRDEPAPAKPDGIIPIPEGLDVVNKNKWWRREFKRCKRLNDEDGRYFEIVDDGARRQFAKLTNDDDPLRYTHARYWLSRSAPANVEVEREEAYCEYAWRYCYEIPEELIKSATAPAHQLRDGTRAKVRKRSGRR
jgi:hypothetical protein